MPVYQYKAVTKKGENIKGTYTANSENEVIVMLRQNQYYPIKITKMTEKSNLFNFMILNRVTTKDIAIFCRQFYTMLNAGVPIIRCLDVLNLQTENKKFKEVIKSVYTHIQKGETFSNGLRNHKLIFPELLINMVEAGEISGNLDGIMDRMAIHYEKESKINNKIQGALVYPIVLSIVSVFVIIFLLVFVMPTFVSMFQGSGIELPAPTRALLFISNTLINYWYIYMIVGISLLYGSNQFIKSEFGKIFIDRLKLKIPIVKSTTQKIITTRFTRTLSTLLSSGIPLIQALESTGRVVGNKVVENGIKNTIEEVSVGASLAGSIQKIGVFPPMVISMIEIGEESGAIDDILDKTANFFDEETETALQKMITMFEPFMITVMAFVVGFIVMAMILPIFNMVNTLNL
ncbi:type II secretion system F family protein [Crassaminicella profunda]|uniref:type II secretion system F family protein n=1 Tax=Crassaminicella profunda TaxID=1286698 RepID=UPI001CA62A2D|nr:type II secretion system F family protein [Crassaminicella profunda]QZY56987.1 type II secretion system F family protein [Crassaminicella profunda]